MNLQKFLWRNFVEIDPQLPNTMMHKTPHARAHTHRGAHTQNEIEETKTASGGGVTPGPPFETGGKSELKPTSLPGPPGWLRHRQISR